MACMCAPTLAPKPEMSVSEANCELMSVNGDSNELLGLVGIKRFTLDWKLRAVKLFALVYVRGA